MFSALAVPLVAQQQQPSGPLTDQRIIELVRAGIHSDELARIIATAPQVNFLLTPAATDEMLKAGVSEEIIKAMAAREQGTTPGEGQQLTAPSAQDRLQGAPVQPGTFKPEREGFGRTDIFVGYSYLNADFNGLVDRQSANGWEASVAFSPIKFLAIEGDGAGYYRPSVLGTSLDVRDYSFMAGPRVNLGPVFVHALFGFDNLGASYLGYSDSQMSFATALGGGIQSKPFARHFAIRSSADYVLTRHNILGGTAVMQNNFRVGGGIVFVFGSGLGRF